MHTSNRRPMRLLASGLVTSALVATTLVAGTTTALAAPALQDGPDPTTHTQKAYAPDADFTAKWSRADARRLHGDAHQAPGVRLAIEPCRSCSW